MPLGKTNLIFNDEVRCPSFPYEAEFIPAVTVQRNANGTVKQSLVHDPHDWMRFTINLGQLTAAQKDAVIEFFMVVGGNIDSFLFRDEYGFGNVVARHTFYTAVGGETTLQAARIFSVGSESRSYELWNFESYGLWKNGSPWAPAVDSSDSGAIGPFTALAPGDVIEGQFSVLRRVRFTGGWKNVLRSYELNDISLVLAEEGVE